ncbi:RNA polymerase sigma-70 factor (ECF subfamily) [Chitinophaga polysaccharea]|uniref:RNA polymerase sigma-70 factor (ECF subfamily) n=1 Tax=Chitinophaga polysaccharea TaxID=1293035 RepID=A0A561PLJ0_9BACT|nr:sigma-70 family RNA polymerase sigma factor [Chitinophaga polysaccharea]TWF38978.1 RNA polymerase sigma-70 factor (ECF subfamily) [Chitinophaga polysaccharea]
MAFNELTDLHLWLQVKQDKGFAFKTLFDRYWEKLYVYAFNRLKSEADAKDVVQEVMISLWSRRASLDIETTLAAYLHAAVQYEVLNHFSRAAKIAGRSQEYEQNILPELNSYIAPLQAKELAALAEVEITRLPEKMQQVYRLRQEKNLSVKEIAGLLNISEQTVRNQLNSSYQKLKKHLKEAMLVAIFLHSN